MECEKCKSVMIEKMGSKGAFMACPNYPECKFTASMPKEADTARDGMHRVITPPVEKVLNDKKGSRDGSYVTAGEIIKEAVKIYTCEDNKGDDGVPFPHVVTMLMDEYKRVREEFR